MQRFSDQNVKYYLKNRHYLHKNSFYSIETGLVSQKEKKEDFFDVVVVVVVVIVLIIVVVAAIIFHN